MALSDKWSRDRERDCDGTGQQSDRSELSYENRGQEEAVLCVTPFFQFEPKGEDLKEDKIFSRQDQRLPMESIIFSLKQMGRQKNFRKRKKRIFIVTMNVMEDEKMEPQAQCIR